MMMSLVTTLQCHPVARLSLMRYASRHDQRLPSYQILLVLHVRHMALSDGSEILSLPHRQASCHLQKWLLRE